jgi:hypothetical protein
VAGCCEYSNITQSHRIGQFLLNGAKDMVEWQAVASAVILPMALGFDRYF